MNAELLGRHFARIGARAKVEPMRGSLALNVHRDRQGEYFGLHADESLVGLEVVDVQPKDRHLLLLARILDSGRKDKFLCGHDERAWFVAAVPDERGVATVKTAKEALKPAIVRQLQHDKRVRFKDRARRKTAAYIRQGEWFFVPRPDVDLDSMTVLRNEPIRRGSGKPHWCALLVRLGGELVHVCSQHPNGLVDAAYRRFIRENPMARHWRWRAMTRNADVFAKGRVSHPDHKTVFLDGWHQVVMNTETLAPSMAHVAFLD